MRQGTRHKTHAPPALVEDVLRVGYPSRHRPVFDLQEKIRRAAQEAFPDDGRAWREWAEFERRAGDDEQFIYKSIRAVEADASDPNYCSSVAFALAE